MQQLDADLTRRSILCELTHSIRKKRKIFFKAHFGKKSRDWFNATNDEDNVKCVSTWIGEQDFWFYHWTAESEDLIHKKLEDLKGDKLFYTLAQEMKSFITHTEPDKDFITEQY